MQNMKGPEPEKKRPGRPKKYVAALPEEKRGIVQASPCPEDIVNLTYCNPKMFAGIMKLYRSYHVAELEIVFDATGMHIHGVDHLNKSTVDVDIHGRDMNMYYCETRARIFVACDKLNKILGAPGNPEKIMFILKRDTCRSKLHVGYKGRECHDTIIYGVNTTHKEIEAERLAYRSDDYPIKFQLSPPKFKQLVNSAGVFGAVINIQKHGTNPLQFVLSESNAGDFIDIMEDPEKIKLQCALADDDIFTISIYIELIKPFANTTIGDIVSIAADKTRRIFLGTTLDGGAADVRVYTEIKTPMRA